MKSLDELFAGVKTAAIAGHIRPDGDCVGSCLATYNYITTYYPQIEVSLYLQPIPNIFKFMKNADKIISDCTADKEFDLFIAQDCGDLGRLGDAAKYFEHAKKTACIDHHISNQSFADENYIFPQASSASELVFELIPRERLTKEIAECIYTGIIHDTGVFQYSCTSEKTMEAAGVLMGMGIDFPKIVDQTFFTKTYEQNRIMGLALVKSKLHLDGKCISSIITAEEMREYNVLPKHLDGIVSQLRVTKDVEAAVFLYQTDEENYKVSTRSASYVDVAKIAAKYGGGGHVRAAGFSVAGDPEKRLNEIIEDIREQLISDVSIKPYTGPYKIYIVDEAEKMTVQAQNALLKTIEEPPAYAVILLLVNNGSTLLPTIASRCVTLNFKPVRDEVIKKYLMEELHVPDYQAEIDASFAQGSIGKAQEAATSEEFGKMTENALRILKYVSTMQTYELTDVIRELSDEKQHIGDYLDIFQFWFRDVLMFKATREIDNLVFKQEINYIKEQASQRSYENLEKILEALEKAKVRLRANVNFELALELLFLTIREK